MPDRPHVLFWRLPADTGWRSEAFVSEPAARARIKTVESKGGYWLLKREGQVIDQNTPKK